MLKCAADFEGVTPPLETMARAVARPSANRRTDWCTLPTSPCGSIAIFKEGVIWLRLKSITATTPPTPSI